MGIFQEFEEVIQGFGKVSLVFLVVTDHAVGVGKMVVQRILLRLFQADFPLFQQTIGIGLIDHEAG